MTTGLRPWQRAVRCPAARRSPKPPPQEPGEQPAERFAGFVALHDALSARPEINPVRLWTGGVTTAVIAAAMTVLGSGIARGVLDVAVPVPVATTADPAAATVAYALCAMALTIKATVLLHVLMERSYQGLRVFAWICMPLIAIAAVLPLAVRSVPVERAVATAAINLTTGIVVLGLLASAGSLSASWPDPHRHPPW